ncbi:MAG TPA: hydantoinase/oxoprolinase family protein [Xanthobacteraceae bacterium]|nr:hydantoinase/oxoprolinase family protein [Xanthobacteraceae bacterium]
MNELAIDIGSAFVDLALRSSAGCRVRKVPIAGHAGAESALAAIDASLMAWSMPLSQIGTIRLASTEPVNALLARRGARVALMATQGFGDCLWLGRQNRANLYDPVARSPAPTFLVDRRDTFEIAGRMDPAGREVAPLDEGAACAAADVMRERGIEAVAICFLFGHVNPFHEKRCAELIRAALPQVDVCLSHEIDPQPREYERTVSVCLEAWLRPMTRRAVFSFEAGLRRRGFAGRLRFSDSRSDLIDAATAATHAVRLVANGPAAAARRAAVAAQCVAARRGIALDIGSTSTDLCLIDNGEPLAAQHAVFADVPLRQAMMDVASIALGGGSRAVHDRHGRFAFVARSHEPKAIASLSEALLVIGRMPPIDVDAASGRGLTTSIALEIVEAAERKVAAGLLDYVVKRNVDPALTTLVVMGGLGSILGPPVAALLGIPQVVCPFAPAASGALGLLASRPRFESVARINAATDVLDASDLADTVAALADAVRAQARVMADKTPTLHTTIEMAVNPHMHPHRVRIDGLPKHPADIAAAFRAQHLDRFGVDPPGHPFIFSLTVDAVADGGAEASLVEMSRVVSALGPTEPALVETDAGAIWKPSGWSLTPVRDGYLLRPEGGQ